jgi:hypothetical protein
MTIESAGARGDPRSLLSGTDRLGRRVRQAQRGTWFPLLVFAAVTFGAIPVDRLGHRDLTCRTGPAGEICAVSEPASFVYWSVALVLAYVLIAAFYLRRSRERGVGTRVWPYVIAGVVIAILVTCAAVWGAHNPPVGEHDILGLHLTLQPSHSFSPFALYNRLTSPAAAIGLGLLVLAWAERNPPLLAVTLGYLVIVVVPSTFGGLISRPSPWVFLPRLVTDGTVLLLAGIGFALAQRRIRQPPP